jgi:hypothetical protein
MGMSYCVIFKSNWPLRIESMCSFGLVLSAGSNYCPDNYLQLAGSQFQSASFPPQTNSPAPTPTPPSHTSKNHSSDYSYYRPIDDQSPCKLIIQEQPPITKPTAVELQTNQIKSNPTQGKRPTGFLPCPSSPHIALFTPSHHQSKLTIHTTALRIHLTTSLGSI